MGSNPAWENKAMYNIKLEQAHLFKYKRRLLRIPQWAATTHR